MALITSACTEQPPSGNGDLSTRFIDENGDMVADLPDNPSDWSDPRKIVFAYTPVEDPAVYRDVWAEFLDHLAETTGREVVFFPVQSNAAQLEAMRAGRLHVTGFNTGSVPLAVNVCGFVPFAMMAMEDGSFGYEMEIIVPADSPIQSVEELRGQTIAFTSPTSNSGFKAPSVILREEFQMEVDIDFEARFSGKHDNSILGVANNDYDAAAIANTVLHRMTDRGILAEDQVRTIYRSPTFPTTAYGHAYNLHPDLAEKIREAFFSFDWEATGLGREYRENQFIPISYKEHWEVIRLVDRGFGITYSDR
ncbi:MAG: phosphate/phosphite/phosphonate ABC transporter substrate-binding protein [Opitutales bacterium]|nr:phosphate/phosphite/phosphonate ABC transporter substrate-binding protein [Opitutales bacterium]